MTVIHEPHRLDGPAGLLAHDPWQMTLGERAALEGLLARLRPELAIEIGTAEGGSTRCLARHCREIHRFDLAHPEGLTDELPDARHAHRRQPRAAAGASSRGSPPPAARSTSCSSTATTRAEGVRRDLEDLLASPAARRTVIVAHDTANEDVRAGLLASGFEDHPAVAFADLDFVAGHLSATGAFAGQLWGGLGLIVVDEEAAAAHRPAAQDDTLHPTGELLRAARDLGLAPAPGR